MAKKTPLDKLQANINKILADYQNQVVKDVDKLTKDMGKKGAAAVRQEAKAHGWGDSTDYDKGWTATFEKGRFSSKVSIHNKNAPGLPHLLENGHALRNGGRSRAFPHIAPVEEKISEEFYKAVKESL